MRLLTTTLTVMLLMIGHWSTQAKTTPPKFASTDNTEEESFVYAKSYFEKMTYTWKDANGAEHTSNLTETVSGWQQIKAFISKIMTDRNIPGMIKDPTPEALRPTNGRRIKSDSVTSADAVVSLDYYSNGYSTWGVPYNKEKTPYEDGLTAIIVGLKADYNTTQSNSTDIKDLVENCVEDMKLMTHRIRVEGDNPGWIFNVRYPLNKFFIMTKGKLRTSYEKPFGWMFEQFSPAENTYIPTDVYNQMLREREFNVLHDCTSVITRYHPTLMGREDDPSEYMSSIFIFIPDSRFGAITEEDADQEDENGKYRVNDQSKNRKVYIGEDWSQDLKSSFIYYKPSATPFIFFNTAKLTVVDVKESNATDGICTVTLDWHTHLGKLLAGTDFYEKYHLYRVVDGEKQLIADLSEYSNPDAATVVALDDNSRVRLVHNDKDDRSVQISIYENQELYAHEVDYVVESAVLDMELSYIDSNIATAIIPGLTPLERCELNLVGYPTSEFHYENDADGNEADYNHYKHDFRLVNRISQNYPLLAGHLKPTTNGENPYLQLIRANTREEVIAGENVEFLDKIIITGNYDDETDGYTYFKAKMPDSDEETLLFRSVTADGDNATVESLKDTDFVWFSTTFDVKTKDNLHPSKYLYRLVTNIPVYDHLNETWDYARSSPIRIDIPHSSVNSAMTGYTLDQILNDADRNLEVSKKSIKYNVVKNLDVEVYDVFYNGKKLLARTRQAQDGTYQQSIYAADGDVEEEGDSTIEEIEPGEQAFELQSNVHKNNGNIVGVITDFDGNTYGTGRAIVPDDIDIECDITNIDQDADNEYKFTIKANWLPSNTDNNQLFATPNRYYNAWLAFDDDPQNVNIFDSKFWDDHDNIRQVVNVSNRANTKLLTDSEIGDNLEYDYTSEWKVGANKSNKEYPLIASLYVRYYPQLLNTGSDTPLYGVYDTYYSAAATGDGNITTGIDELVNTQVYNVDIYSLQGIRLASFTADGYDDIIPRSGLSSGIYIFKINGKMYKIQVK